ncbi:MAG: acetyl-CoA C-acetyltransferase [Saprospiraceae bacterium]|jgi:acetyl-CoA C-acetyltransferase
MSKKKEVVIVAAKRTAIGSFGGCLSAVSAPKLGAAAIKGAIRSCGLDVNLVDEVFMGNVMSANLGQAPARQAAIFAGLPTSVPCTTINKVCASGMKSISLGVQSILLGDNEVVVVGGMENMSSVPHYSADLRFGKKLGNSELVDGLVKDGLTDVYNDYHMGNAAEKCAAEYGISREDQDEFAIASYKKSAEAWKDGKFLAEITPVEIKTRKGVVEVIEDEEYQNVRLDKIPNLRTVFQKEGTITAANASTLNDGAAALVLMSANKARELNMKPLAKITAYADAAIDPEWFTIAPSVAVPKALGKLNLTADAVEFWELNEAFSVVGIVNCNKLKVASNKVNVNGGAVSLGHPLGCSGARIVVTLINVLKQNNGKIGAAGICNGGGGASALIIENV